MEEGRKNDVKQIVYASSSSVYGLNIISPFTETQNTDLINSPYSASKKTMEIYGKLYNQLYDMNIIGLRFFTVYGPWGRPDMAMYIFADKIREGKKIPVFNHGKMKRDFTYIDDIINGTRLSIDKNYENIAVKNLYSQTK